MRRRTAQRAIRFVKFNYQGFLKTDLKEAYTKVWFDPVEEYIIVLKDGVDKDSFPSQDMAIYHQNEIVFCDEMIQNVPKDVAYEKVRGIHFLIKNFQGTLVESHFEDPDPTLSHTPDTRFWKRLNDYAHSVVKKDGFIDSVKALRVKGFSIIESGDYKPMTFQKPDHITDIQAKQFVKAYMIPFFDDFKDALEMIRDISTKVNHEQKRT